MFLAEMWLKGKHLPSMHETLSLIPSTTKNKQTKNKCAILVTVCYQD
jgi:hypothetical protein